ncbi:Uncharacterised protein [Serratia quinivorans]|jgi:hypothetical protein|nr:Uncharacterised protein [Serratia quinivorans]
MQLAVIKLCHPRWPEVVQVWGYSINIDECNLGIENNIFIVINLLDVTNIEIYYFLHKPKMLA